MRSDVHGALGGRDVSSAAEWRAPDSGCHACARVAVMWTAGVESMQLAMVTRGVAATTTAISDIKAS
jgi:hypothetical protein